MLVDRLRQLVRPSPGAAASYLTTTPMQEQDAMRELEMLCSRLDAVRAYCMSYLPNLTDRPAVKIPPAF